MKWYENIDSDVSDDLVMLAGILGLAGPAHYESMHHMLNDIYLQMRWVIRRSSKARLLLCGVDR